MLKFKLITSKKKEKKRKNQLGEKVKEEDRMAQENDRKELVVVSLL